MIYITECFGILILSTLFLLIYRIRLKLGLLKGNKKSKMWLVAKISSFILNKHGESRIVRLSANQSNLLKGSVKTSLNVLFPDNSSLLREVLSAQDINLNIQDNHNVHNLTISNSAQRYLNQNICTRKISADISQIIDYFSKEEELIKEYTHLLDVLEFIRKANALYSKHKIPEGSILNLVWSEIQKLDSVGKRQELIKYLAFQINDCYNNDEKDEPEIWCLEGRVVRFLQSLVINDTTEFELVPLWYYKNEIGNYCADKLDLIVKNMTETEQKIYFKEQPDQKEKTWIEKINNELIEELENYFNREYSCKIGKKQLGKITGPCYQAIKA